MLITVIIVILFLNLSEQKPVPWNKRQSQC